MLEHSPHFAAGADDGLRCSAPDTMKRASAESGNQAIEVEQRLNRGPTVGRIMKKARRLSLWPAVSWSGGRDSNPQQSAWKADALPIELPPQSGRGDWIRTSDPLLPKQMRYQAALRPEARRIVYVSRGVRAIEN